MSGNVAEYRILHPARQAPEAGRLLPCEVHGVSIVLDSVGDPRRRRRELLVGFVVAAAAAAVVFGVAVPWFVGVIREGAVDLDARLRADDRLMNAVCAAPVPGRDDRLCGCALAVPFPSLDCQDRFRPWLAARAAELCANGALSATAFCACVTTVVEDETAGADPPLAVRAMPRCRALDDAPPAPELIRLLAPAGVQDPPPGS